MKLRLICVLGLAALCAAPPAAAQSRNQCIDKCFSTFSGDDDSELRRECLEECNKPSIQYGAIAYGAVSNAYGYAFGKGNAADAMRTALNNCRQHGQDCKLVGTYANACMAVAAVEAKNRFVYATAPGGNQARANAMKSCQSQIGGKCEIEVWSCAGS